MQKILLFGCRGIGILDNIEDVMMIIIMAVIHSFGNAEDTIMI